MKLVLTLLARDEADVVDAHLAFHLNAGVDFVVATDNGSEDGTTEILERYERAGHLHLIREPGADMRQSEWVTRMARLAATDVRRRLGDQLRRRRVLVAALRVAEGRPRGRPGAVRRRARRVASLPAAARRRRPVLRAHDGAAPHPRGPRRQGDDLPRASEGRAPRPGGRRRRRREPRRRRRRAACSRCVAGIRSRSCTSRFDRERSSSTSRSRSTKRGCGAPLQVPRCTTSVRTTRARRATRPSTTDHLSSTNLGSSTASATAHSPSTRDFATRSADSRVPDGGLYVPDAHERREPPALPAAVRRGRRRVRRGDLAARRDRRSRPRRAARGCARTAARGARAGAARPPRRVAGGPRGARGRAS